MEMFFRRLLFVITIIIFWVFFVFIVEIITFFIIAPIVWLITGNFKIVDIYFEKLDIVYNWINKFKTKKG